MATDLYQKLCAEFAETHTLPKGGANLEYLTGESVTTRLNEVLGLDGWEFRILGNGQDAETVWVHGQLTAFLPERTVVREQFGECQSSRGIALGDARKGAATDALKKCASLIGVGLYLSRKEVPHQVSQQRQPNRPIDRATANYDRQHNPLHYYSMEIERAPSSFKARVALDEATARTDLPPGDLPLLMQTFVTRWGKQDAPPQDTKGAAKKPAPDHQTLMDRWAELWGIADGLKIPHEQRPKISPDDDDAELIAAGKKLGALIEVHRKQQTGATA